MISPEPGPVGKVVIWFSLAGAIAIIVIGIFVYIVPFAIFLAIVSSPFLILELFHRRRKT